MVLTVYAILIALLWMGLSVYFIASSQKVPYLKAVPAFLDGPEPSVAIIIAVKDEEAEVAQALNSVCRLDYSNYRIIVINDRSTDQTPVILDKMAQAHPELSLITIKDLPQGWLGKNHALYKGYCASSEEWLLFTDADVIYNRMALKKAMSYAMANQSDHLAVLPQITSRSALFTSVMNTFALMLEIRHRPWDVSNPSSNAYIGIGAFNLIKRTAYEKAGTHTVISLRPDDDLKLGERIKAAGLRQGVLYGEKELSLQWYTSLKEFVRGLMKNSFSVSNYRLPVAIGMALLTFMFFVMPVPLLLVSGNVGRIMALVILASQTFLMLFKRGIRGRWWHALMIPFSGLVMVYILIVSALKTIKQGGIYWRNSFYPLTELKKQS
jgi:cellulose synthase/poly-beta-1,6-N-acetylglucosamine synthase-like glycosyltransferase